MQFGRHLRALSIEPAIAAIAFTNFSIPLTNIARHTAGIYNGVPCGTEFTFAGRVEIILGYPVAFQLDNIRQHLDARII